MLRWENILLCCAHRAVVKFWVDNTVLRRSELCFLDRVVGDILSGLSARGVMEESTVVLTSDHEYRALVPVGERARVPLLIKRSRQQVLEDVDTPVFTPVVVRELLTRRSSLP